MQITSFFLLAANVAISTETSKLSTEPDDFDLLILMLFDITEHFKWQHDHPMLDEYVHF